MDNGVSSNVLERIGVGVLTLDFLRFDRRDSFLAKHSPIRLRKRPSFGITWSIGVKSVLDPVLHFMNDSAHAIVALFGAKDRNSILEDLVLSSTIAI